MPRKLSLNSQTDVALSCLMEQPQKQWELDGELSAWRSFRQEIQTNTNSKKKNTNTNSNTNTIRRGCEGLNQRDNLVKKNYEVEDKCGKVEEEDEEEEDEDEEVFRLLDLPEELLELLGKYLDVATTLALASTCSLLQAILTKLQNVFS